MFDNIYYALTVQSLEFCYIDTTSKALKNLVFLFRSAKENVRPLKVVYCTIFRLILEDNKFIGGPT